jgi:hypothetical protein
MKMPFILMFVVLIQSCGSLSPSEKSSQSLLVAEDSPKNEILPLDTPDIPPLEINPSVPVTRPPVFVLKPLRRVRNRWDSWVFSSYDGYCLMIPDSDGILQNAHATALSRRQVVDSLKTPLDMTRNVLVIGSTLTNLLLVPAFVVQTGIFYNENIGSFLRQDQNFKSAGTYLSRISNLSSLGIISGIAFFTGMSLWTYGWIKANSEFDAISSLDVQDAKSQWTYPQLNSLSLKLKSMTPATALDCN